MNVEEQLRSDLKELTHDVPRSLNLDQVVLAGRSRRRRRHVVAGVGTCALLTGISWGGTGLVDSLTTSGRESQQLQPAIAGAHHVLPAHQLGHGKKSDLGAQDVQDFVPGTDIDEHMQTVINGHLDPGLHATVTDVYPSDWNHDGAMPDAQWQNATDWQAVYTIPGGQRLLVIMFYVRPGDSCTDGASQQAYSLNGTYFEASGRTDCQTRFGVNSILSVSADSEAQATQKFALSTAQLAAISEDNGLAFAAPINPPS